MANLRLDGILPHDVTTKADYALTQALIRGTRLPYTLLTDGEDTVTAATLYLTMQNPSQHELSLQAQFMHAHEITLEPSRLEMTLAPGSQQIVEVAITSSEPQETKTPALLQLDWTMGFEFDELDEEDLFLSGTRNIALRPSSKQLIATVAPEYVDSLDVAAIEIPEERTLHITRDGTSPTTESPEYEGPLSISEAATVKARLFNEHGHGTTTDTQTYRPVAAGSGLRYRFYKGAWTRMPDFSELEPAFESVATALDVEARQLRADNWGIVLDGKLVIDTPGQYTFHVKSDDGSMLYIDDALVVDNDGDHSLLELSGTTELSAGTHDLRIEFFDSLGEAILEIGVEGPDMPRQPLPFDKLSH